MKSVYNELCLWFNSIYFVLANNNFYNVSASETSLLLESFQRLKTNSKSI